MGRTISWSPWEGKCLCSLKDTKSPAWPVHLIQDDAISLYCPLCKAAAGLGDYPVHKSTWIYIYFHCCLSCLSLSGCCVPMINDVPKHIWLRKLMDFVWEAATQVVELYLQSSVMSLLGGLGCRDPPKTSVPSYQKVMSMHVTGNKFRSLCLF